MKIFDPPEEVLDTLLDENGEFSMARTEPLYLVVGDQVFSEKKPPKTPSEMVNSSYNTPLISVEVHFGTFDIWNHPRKLSEDLSKTLDSESTFDIDSAFDSDSSSGDETASIICVERGYNSPLHINGTFSVGKYTTMTFSQMVEKVQHLCSQGYFVVEDRKNVRFTKSVRIENVLLGAPVTVDYSALNIFPNAKTSNCGENTTE